MTNWEQLRSTGHLWNFSFADVLEVPFEVEGTLRTPGFSSAIKIQLCNNAELFENQKKWAQYHHHNNKQILGYNPYGPGQTGFVQILYSDHPSELASRFAEDAMEFLHRELSVFLSFMQRRRVLITNARMRPKAAVITMPVFAEAEKMDAVAFGPIAVPDVQAALDRFSAWQKSSPDELRKAVFGILTRMSNLTNLPYTYERAEGYWRILEALGKSIGDDTTSDANYAQAKLAVGANRDSSNLKSLTRSLTSVAAFDCAALAASFKFRNEITHEFVEFDYMGSNEALTAMNYLQRGCELLIASKLGFSPTQLLPPQFGSIFGRVI